MCNSFSSNLAEAFFHSRYDLCLQNRETNEQYQHVQEQHEITFNRIRDLLGKDRKMMLELERLQNELGSIDDE